jgi:membrane-bound lytic murein transglycosylase D
VQSRYGVDRATLRRLNPAWSARAASGRIPLPAGHRVWLPEGTLAGRPRVPETAVAESRPEPKRSAAVQRYHRVKAGDTLWSVAKRYGLEVAELRRMNGLSSKSSRIRTGQRLRVGHTSGS